MNNDKEEKHNLIGKDEYKEILFNLKDKLVGLYES